MHRVLLLGAGKIGRMISRLLVDSGDYEVLVGDISEAALERIAKLTGAATRQIDASNPANLSAAMQGVETVISALSFQHNPLVARAALEAGISYFDLTEDVATSDAVAAISENAAAGQIFMPQCGLAPGFISIVANDLLDWFDRVETVRMRVGALPQFPTGELKYNLTWSTDGLINEYCNPCEAIHGGRRIDLLPLEGLEHFSLDGVHYEAFNTSGGLGTLCDTLDRQGARAELQNGALSRASRSDETAGRRAAALQSPRAVQGDSGAGGAHHVSGCRRDVLHGNWIAKGAASPEERRP